MSDGVKAVGLSELRKALKQVEPNAGKMLRDFYRQVADLVQAAAQSKAAAQGGVVAKAAPAFKAQATQTKASIKIDAAGGYPFALGAEFGALKFPQFKPWRGNQYVDPLGQGVGYAVHPAIRESAPEIIDAAERGLTDLTNHLAKD